MKIDENDFNKSKCSKAFSDSAYEAKLQKIGGVLLEHAKLLYAYLKSPHATIGDKALIVAALGYLILPTDLIPDLIPIAGFVDDAAVLLFVVTKCANGIEKVKKSEQVKENNADPIE